METRRHARSSRSPLRGRSLPIASALFALGAVVVIAEAVVSIRDAWPVEETPDVASVSCTSTGPTLARPVVAPQPDGVHLTIANPTGAQQYDIHPARWDVGSSVGGDLGPGLTRTQISAPPGTLLVTCLGEHGFTWGPPARLRVIDPTGLWVSPEPACSDQNVREVDVGLPPDDLAPIPIARSTLVGLHGSDLLLKPGYPQTLWHGNLVVVVRDGSTIAAVTQYLDHGRWIVHLQACPGSKLLTPA